MHRVIIIGGGFGGLHAARSLNHAPVEVVLIDRTNYHLFQPLLYQVATGALSPANIAAPLRALLKRQANARVLLGEVTALDAASRRVTFNGESVSYDTLIVAAGSRHSYFSHPEWERFAPGLKTIEDATAIRRRILFAFEAAERLQPPAAVGPWLTFVLVGGGPTGVEMAGAVAEIARHTLRHEFRSINPAAARILLIEADDRILPPFPHDLSERAARSLERLGVEVMLRTRVTDIEQEAVVLDRDGVNERIPTHTVLWAAGVEASPLGRLLAQATGGEVDRVGRVIVGPDLSLPGHPEIFVIGDLAHFAHQTGKPLPALAPVAMQQGQYVARLIRDRLQKPGFSETAGLLTPAAQFVYKDHGIMATIGGAKAVAVLGGLHFSGVIAWLIWLFIHLMQLVQFQNRVLVLIQWAWHYSTRNRYARLITGRDADRPTEKTV